MYISQQPISPLIPSFENPHSASGRLSTCAAEPDIDIKEKVDTNDEPPALPRRELINRHWNVVITLTILLFIFGPARPASITRLDEDVILQMAHRMNNLAVPCPGDLAVNVQNNPPLNTKTVATLKDFEKQPQEYLRQGHILYCSLINPDSPWSNDLRYVYALPDDTVKYLLLGMNKSVIDQPVVAPVFERSRRISLVEKRTAAQVREDH
ncbi:hypothetical protein FPRO04_10346 [Fusarium proliferatum]|uniref:Uncharacterized protein n=1 Tax=Gibberella intermedia TaxID=948311 RepID=A0A365N1A6_GIBIN|nr:hypothetical protein FPRO03_11409 [Fusarium proliferatum]KAG4272831.1 hypothetical protein FPRO04_10346 [Fusarium proliferatum]RBA14482.1 hypothetical protein FPRO05_03274 [Fusarium proliferatum]RKL32511.1 hypothetical protein BFJ72_g10454 [Fusarium proliferatum]